MTDGAKARRKADPGEQQRLKAELTEGLQRVVVKIGSGVLAGPDGLNRTALNRVVREIATAWGNGLEITVVSSGAIAAGRPLLGQTRRDSIPDRQAAAAVGQIQLMSEYRRAFARRDIVVAQILLDADDLENRRRYLNAEHALRTLHLARALPIVNENDTVAVEELMFGDNDNLSAVVASLVGADLLVILSDVDGLHTGNPRTSRTARRIPVVERIDDQLLASVGGSGPLGTGGMRSKLLAARKAAAAGIATMVVDGRSGRPLRDALDPDRDLGTLFPPGADRLARRKHWIAFARKTRGTVVCDDGARTAVLERGRSLLPSGVTDAEGRFEAGDCVRLVDRQGDEFARGLVTYGADDIRRIAGKRSAQVTSILGYKLGDEIVHRDEMVLLGERPDRAR